MKFSMRKAALALALTSLASIANATTVTVTLQNLSPTASMSVSSGNRSSFPLVIGPNQTQTFTVDFNNTTSEFDITYRSVKGDACRFQAGHKSIRVSPTVVTANFTQSATSVGTGVPLCNINLTPRTYQAPFDYRLNIQMGSY
ncbi:hypothetical protein [Pseudomonas cichorii]|uniref:hypothetical protein n=1 Tax=Pseudomonas cichorii TaxID=36746 RepID=UPI001C8A44E8|nr:hypothetical protein [Pseudomonas cichorii]MBX8483929.1 hypothetical protein [Pseudomonas cichorii]MBX8497102.1 hypothetical protein [Pseudomonas cichorii]MBX8514993.1 hypothetical protein [Pseudomonas cichorii]MBX8530185.1 hypothetical protein [Pseudomonas cichorii]MBX8576370.1 hypothetical protein [Pseudomonas cichorii]